MEKIFNRTEKILTILGLNSFNKNTETIFHKSRRILFYVIGTIFNTIFAVWCINKSGTHFTDRVILVAYVIGYISCGMHAIYFWEHRVQFREMVKWVKSLYKPRSHTFVERESQLMFNKCFRIVHKVTK